MTCECPIAGICKRRGGIKMPAAHHTRCQAGQHEAIDRFYAREPENAVTEITTRAKTRRKVARAALVKEAVGAALKARIAKLVTIKTNKGCNCNNLAADMDRWGIAGCEQRREQIIDHLIGNRDMLTEALRADGHWWQSFIVSHSPDALLRVGAGHLLTQAIEDVRSKKKIRVVSRKPKSCRVASAQITPRPFTAEPRMTLICHNWPHGENWRKHAEYIEPVNGVFHRKIMGVATGNGAASFDEVRRVFGDSWEYFEVKNDSSLREVATYPRMLRMAESVGENDVTFCIHTKGAQDSTSANAQIKWWTEAMYQTVIYNWRNVLKKMEQGYPIVGSFKRHGSQLGTRNAWHYSGTFYAFRNADTFTHGIPEFDGRWFGTESWPGHHFLKIEAACMFGDLAGDLYKENKQLEQALIEWRQHNET